MADSEIETSRYKYCLRNEHFKVALVEAEYFCTDQWSLTAYNQGGP